MSLMFMDLSGENRRFKYCLVYAEDVILHIPKFEFLRHGSITRYFANPDGYLLPNTPICLVGPSAFDRIKRDKWSTVDPLSVYVPKMPIGVSERSSVVLCMDHVEACARDLHIPTEVMFTYALTHALMHVIFEGTDHSHNYHATTFAQWFEEAHATAFALNVMEQALDSRMLWPEHLQALRDYNTGLSTENAFGVLLHGDLSSVADFPINTEFRFDRCQHPFFEASRLEWMDFVRKSIEEGGTRLDIYEYYPVIGWFDLRNYNIDDKLLDDIEEE